MALVRDLARLLRCYDVRAASRGFSFIEFATAIIVLGIVFIAVLRGSEILVPLRALVTAQDMEQLLAKIARYREAYGALPGEDPRAVVRFGRPPSLFVRDRIGFSLQGNFVIDGRLWEVGSPEGEQFMAWSDLRRAGLLDGDPTLVGLSSMPEHPLGGVFGLDQGNLGQKGGSLCATRIPGRAAEMIDKKYDDGLIDKGRIVATSKYSVEEENHFNAPDAAPYNIEKEYIICSQLPP